MSNIANSPDALAAIRQRKLAVKQKMESSRQQMSDTASGLMGSPAAKSTDRVHGITRLVRNGVTIYNGYRILATVFGALGFFFGRRRRKK